MSGFTNLILKVLLGWLRTLIDAVWALFGSDGGGAMLAFLRANWKLLFLILCIGGLVVDRVVYLIRWRPYYVWRAKRARRRRGWEDAPQDEGGEPAYGAGYYPAAGHPYPPAEDGYDAEGDAYPPQATARYAPQPRFGGDAPTYRYTPPERVNTDSYPADKPYPNGPTQPYGQQQAPAPHYGEPSTYTPGDLYAPTAAFQPVQYDAPTGPEPFEGEPLFDDDLAQWNAPGNAFADFAPRLSPENNPAYGMDSAFGAPQPEPAQYLRDVQAGFAPQPAPEQRYAPQREPAAPMQPPPRMDTPANESVHPGLDVETFQQNIGLTGGIAAADSKRPADAHTDFSPFAAMGQQDSPQGKARGFGALAKKARTLVSGEDERNTRTIRDLQPAVDVKSAFRAPVYPRKNPESEDDA